MAEEAKKKGLTVVPYDPTPEMPPELREEYPGLKPGRKKKFFNFYIPKNGEAPEMLSEIYSGGEKYRPVAIVRTDIREDGGYSMLVHYVEGGFITDEEAASALERAKKTMQEAAERNAAAMGGRPEDLFGPGQIESPLGQEDRKPIDPAAIAGAIDFEEPIPQAPAMFAEEEPAPEPALEVKLAAVPEPAPETKPELQISVTDEGKKDG